MMRARAIRIVPLHQASGAVSSSGDGKTEHVSRSDAAALDAADDQYLGEADRFHQDITVLGGGARTLHRARAEREPSARARGAGSLPALWRTPAPGLLLRLRPP